jgi:hypothetical protein
MTDISSFYEGTTKVFSITITHNSVAPDITLDTVRFIMKRNSTDSDADALINKTADVTTSGASGIAIFTLSQEDTEIPLGTYYYEITWAIAGSGECTMTIADPCIVTKALHGLSDEQVVYLTTTGALPTGLAVSTNYYVDYITVDTFHLTATAGGANINTTGTQSGVHTLHYFTSYYVLQSSQVEVLNKITDNI